MQPMSTIELSSNLFFSVIAVDRPTFEETGLKYLKTASKEIRGVFQLFYKNYDSENFFLKPNIVSYACVARCGMWQKTLGF